jgi:putative holliday junction resolvase
MPDTPDKAGSRPETILAFDFGLRRIGVAVGQSVTASASPLGVVANGANGPDFDAISKMIDEWRPARLIVGLPLHADGSPSEMQSQIDDFVSQLGSYQLQVDTVDERYTSVEAEAVLKNARASGSRGRISRDAIDSTAAVLIAERFLTGRTNV